MLQADDLRVRAGGRTLIEGLTLVLRAGECHALLGRNGSGKTSLLLALAGLRAAAGGRVRLDGRALADWPRRALARRLAILLQDDAGDYWGSTLDYVRLGAFASGRDDGGERARRWLERLGLGEHQRQRLRTLSGGERQRARIAQLLVQDAGIMLLDEPLQHLDLAQQARVMALLAEQARAGRALLVSLHEPVMAARCCDHAVLLYDSGGAVQGRSETMLTRERLETLYQCRLEYAGMPGAFVPAVSAPPVAP